MGLQEFANTESEGLRASPWHPGSQQALPYSQGRRLHSHLHWPLLEEDFDLQSCGCTGAAVVAGES